MKIRFAKLNDIESVINLTKIPEFDNPNSSSNMESKAYFKEYIKKGIFLVAEDKGVILGFIAGEFMLGSYVYIDTLAVDSKMRGKGIGKELTKRFEKEAKKKGAKYIHLTAPEFNKNTLSFYESQGFDKGKTFIQFYKKL